MSQNIQPLFSIITVVYNEKNNIEKTINSVINQTFNNYEYIIIDGKSTDGTIEIIKKHNEYIDYFISEKDYGIYDAMNKGINASTGKYCIFMNGGDLFYSNETLQIISNQIQTSIIEPLFIYGDAFEEDFKNNLIYKKSRNHKYMFYGMFTHHQSMLYSLNLIKNKQLNYDLKYKIASDYEFTLKNIKQINNSSILYVNVPICIFSTGGVSTINANSGFKEQFNIKIKYFPLVIVLIFSCIQYILILIKKHLPFIYKAIRSIK